MERKVYDTFLFNNELDLLEIRLNILSDYVDYFVLVESTETFTGLPKPLYYSKNQKRFEKWSNKIIHFVIDNFDENLWEFSRKSPNVGAAEHFWVREFYQKENILKAFTANDNDIVFVSDLDEIWNPLIIDIKSLSFDNDKVYRPLQTAYHYFLNNRSNQNISGWVGTRFGSFATLKKSRVNYFRTESRFPSIQIENAGWHFTNIGNHEFIKQKLESYSHQEYNNPYIVSNVENNINSENDPFFRGKLFKMTIDETYPSYILNNLEKYKTFIKE